MFARGLEGKYKRVNTVRPYCFRSRFIADVQENGEHFECKVGGPSRATAPTGAESVGEFDIKPTLPSVNFVEEFTAGVKGKHLTQGAERSIMAKL